VDEGFLVSDGTRQQIENLLRAQADGTGSGVPRPPAVGAPVQVLKIIAGGSSTYGYPAHVQQWDPATGYTTAYGGADVVYVKEQNGAIPAEGDLVTARFVGMDAGIGCFVATNGPGPILPGVSTGGTLTAVYISTSSSAGLNLSLPTTGIWMVVANIIATAPGAGTADCIASLVATAGGSAYGACRLWYAPAGPFLRDFTPFYPGPAANGVGASATLVGWFTATGLPATVGLSLADPTNGPATGAYATMSAVRFSNGNAAGVVMPADTPKYQFSNDVPWTQMSTGEWSAPGIIDIAY
jgi:hypothetical protein